MFKQNDKKSNNNYCHKEDTIKTLNQHIFQHTNVLLTILTQLQVSYQTPTGYESHHCLKVDVELRRYLQQRNLLDL